MKKTSWKRTLESKIKWVGESLKDQRKKYLGNVRDTNVEKCAVLWKKKNGHPKKFMIIDLIRFTLSVDLNGVNWILTKL